MRSQEDFREYVDYAFEEWVIPLLTRKGAQYTDGMDCFANFKEGAELMSCTPEFDLLHKASKHWMALTLWSKGRTSEPPKKQDLYERCLDLIVYLFLLMYMLHCNVHQSEVK